MHLGQFISTHPKELLTRDPSLDSILQTIGTSCNVYDVRKYYENNPAQLQADVPYIIGLLLHYSDVYQKIKLHQLCYFLLALILPVCNKAQLNKCRTLYLQNIEARPPQIFIDKKVALTANQVYNLLRSNESLEVYAWLDVQKNAIFENVKVAKAYLQKLWKLNWMDVNPEHVFTAVKTTHPTGSYSDDHDIFIFAKQLLEYHDHAEGIAYLSFTSISKPVKDTITETDLTTISLASRNKVLSALKTKSYVMDVKELSEEAKQRLKLLICQGLLSQEFGFPAVAEILFQILDHDLTKVKEFHTICCEQRSILDTEPKIEKKELAFARSQSLHQYLICKYFPIVKKVLNWDLQYFESQYPTVYSLIPFMSRLVKAGAWFVKELEVDNAEILYFIENYTELYTEEYEHSTTVKQQKFATLLSGAKVKSLTENAAYLLAFLSFHLDRSESSIPFSSVKFKELMTLIYGKVEIKQLHKSKAFYFDIELRQYVEDPIPVRSYMEMYKSGIPFKDLLAMKSTFPSIKDKVKASMITMHTLVVRSAPIKLNCLSWWKLICKSKLGVLSADWIEDMQYALKLSKAPDSLDQLIDLYVKTDPKFKALMLGPTLKNRYAILEEDESSLPLLFDIVRELQALGSYQAKEHSNLPNIKFDIDNEYEAFILPPGDQRALIIGTLTGCCQHINGAAKSIAVTSYTDPDQGVFVVAAKTGRIIAQSFIWHGDINRPEKVKGKFKPENFNGKLLAIDSIEYHRYDNSVSQLEKVIAKGYYLFMQEMQKQGYVVGLNPDENTESTRVVRILNNMKNCSTSDYLAPMTNATSDYQKKLGYTDLSMSECHGFIVKNS